MSQCVRLTHLQPRHSQQHVTKIQELVLTRSMDGDIQNCAALIHHQPLLDLLHCCHLGRHRLVRHASHPARHFVV
jgi:hypothetical protein